MKVVDEGINNDLQVFTDKLQNYSKEDLEVIKLNLEVKGRETIAIKNMLLTYFKDEEEYHTCLRNLYLLIEKINSMLLIVNKLLEDKFKVKK